MLRNGYILRNDDLLMGYSRPPDNCPLCGVTDDKNDWEREDLGKWKCKICGQISEVEVIPDNDFIRKMDSIRKMEHKLSFRKAEIEKHITAVLEKWHRITGRKDRDELQWDKWEIVEMDGELYLIFDWSVSWQFGGNSDGRFSVPFKYFYDEESLLQLEDEWRVKKELEDAEMKRRMKERRRMQYEKLKKEFEDGENGENRIVVHEMTGEDIASDILQIRAEGCETIECDNCKSKMIFNKSKMIFKHHKKTDQDYYYCPSCHSILMIDQEGKMRCWMIQSQEKSDIPETETIECDNCKSKMIFKHHKKTDQDYYYCPSCHSILMIDQEAEKDRGKEE